MLKIKKIDADWKEIKNECRNTINKEDTDKEPSKNFIRKLLISEHSPIRLATIKWRWEGIKSWVSVHFSRHWLGWDKFVSTQRTDRTGKNRDESPQGALVNMDVNANAQALINVSRWRLCYQASTETRKEMENLKKAIRDAGQEEIAFCMQPNCVYRGGCPEMKSCGYWKEISNHFTIIEESSDIENRYYVADKIFYERVDRNYTKRTNR